jgi:hypothetical protein
MIKSAAIRTVAWASRALAMRGMATTTNQLAWELKSVQNRYVGSPQAIGIILMSRPAMGSGEDRL